jgi:hypothetical protein
MTRKLKRAAFARRLEYLEARTLLTTSAWQGYASNAQHTALSAVASNSLQSILWHTPVDLNPQHTSSGDLLIHYGSPSITAANTVLVPVKTGAASGFEVRAFSGKTGTLEWTVTTDYSLMPKNGGSGSGWDWTPSYGPSLTLQNNYYFAGNGGTVYKITNPDSTGPSHPPTTQLAFYGLSKYHANPAAHNSTVYINTPITSDAVGNIYFGVLVTGSNPSSIKSGVARITPNGTGSIIPVVSGMSQVATNSAPAVSNDGNTVYALEITGNFGRGKLVAMNFSTMTVTGQVALMDVLHPANTATISNDATASPMVGPNGNVYIGVLENPFASNHDRGWLLQFNSTLTKEGIPGDFGWDDTPSVVPASMVPQYKGPSSYLLMVKYNNYAGEGGNGINKVAVLDPNQTEKDPSTGATVMKEILTIAGVTPDPGFPNVPGAVREWCINSAAVDPASDSILVNSEDGYLYRWNLSTNNFTQKIKLNKGVGEAYTPTLIGPNGTVYAIGNATLDAVGGPSLTTASYGSQDTKTEGNWIGKYGSQGYDVIGDARSLPGDVTITPSGASTSIPAPSTTDVRALRNPNGAGRIGAFVYGGPNFSIDLNLGDGQTHNVELYFLDWSNTGRSERVQITNAVSGAVLSTQTISSFYGGVYQTYSITGNVVITFTKLAGPNAVLSGLFFDPAPTPAVATHAALAAPVSSVQQVSIGEGVFTAITEIGTTEFSTTRTTSHPPLIVSPAPSVASIAPTDKLVHDVALQVVSSDERRPHISST